MHVRLRNEGIPEVGKGLAHFQKVRAIPMVIGKLRTSSRAESGYDEVAFRERVTMLAILLVVQMNRQLKMAYHHRASQDP